MKMLRGIAVAATVIGLLVVAGCENTDPTPAQRDEVEKTVTAYLNALSESYSSLNVSAIEPLATPPEVQRVRKLIRGLVGTGDRVEARLLSVDVTKISVFREINAMVTTTEVWDVTRYDAFNGREKGRNPTSIQDSVIQMRKIDGTWRVAGRHVIGQEAEPKIEPATPVPGDETSQ